MKTATARALITSGYRLDMAAKAKDNAGKTALDYAQTNEKLKGTDAYWKLNEAQY